MKKILSIICLGLISIFAFVGCSAQKNVTKLLDAQNNFKSQQEENLDLSKQIFSNELEIDYTSMTSDQKLDLRTLEKLVQTSNMTLSKLKVYLENNEVVKKLNDDDVKNLIKLQNNYYDNFKNLISFKNDLEDVISHGSSNIKTDYEKLNSKIKSTLITSAECSKKLTDMLKKVYNINIKADQETLNVGELEILTIEASVNLVYFYSKIYIEETNLASFGNLTPDMNIDDVLSTLSELASSKFELTKDQFTAIKNEVLTMQNLNNSLLSKSGYFANVINNFNYETLKENAKTAYPNELKIENSVLLYVSSDKINVTTQANYKYIADIISNTFAPAINNILNICDYISSL